MSCLEGLDGSDFRNCQSDQCYGLVTIFLIFINVGLSIASASLSILYMIRYSQYKEYISS